MDPLVALPFDLFSRILQLGGVLDCHAGAAVCHAWQARLSNMIMAWAAVTPRLKWQGPSFELAREGRRNHTMAVIQKGPMYGSHCVGTVLICGGIYHRFGPDADSTGVQCPIVHTSDMENIFDLPVVLRANWPIMDRAPDMCAGPDGECMYHGREGHASCTVPGVGMLVHGGNDDGLYLASSALLWRRSIGRHSPHPHGDKYEWLTLASAFDPGRQQPAFCTHLGQDTGRQAYGLHYGAGVDCYRHQLVFHRYSCAALLFLHEDQAAGGTRDRAIFRMDLGGLIAAATATYASDSEEALAVQAAASACCWDLCEVPLPRLKYAKLLAALPFGHIVALVGTDALYLLDAEELECTAHPYSGAVPRLGLTPASDFVLGPDGSPPDGPTPASAALGELDDAGLAFWVREGRLYVHGLLRATAAVCGAGAGASAADQTPPPLAAQVLSCNLAELVSRRKWLFDGIPLAAEWERHEACDEGLDCPALRFHRAHTFGKKVVVFGGVMGNIVDRINPQVGEMSGALQHLSFVR